MKTPRIYDNVFKGKKIFVTGHTGFKGAWLCLWLLELGAKVTGYALKPNTGLDLYTQCRLATAMESHIADIRDSAKLRKALARAKPEIVFHLAAQPLVKKSYQDPAETFSTNLLGTVHLLEILKGLDSVKVCEIITSDKCYDVENAKSAYQENDKLGGRDPYSASKACAELITASYRNVFANTTSKSSHVSLSTARAGNVIGGGDWSQNRIIPDCVRALSKKETIEVRNPDSIRPWQYVLDCLSGYLSLAQHQIQFPSNPSFASAWNFGPNPEQNSTVSELADLVIENWGSGNWKKANSNLLETQTLRLDCAKAKTSLNWEPVYQLSESIEKTINWYQNSCTDKKFEALSFSRNQIRDYVQSAANRHAHWTGAQEISHAGK